MSRENEDLKVWFKEFNEVLEKNIQDPRVTFKSAGMIEQEFKFIPYNFDPSRKVRTYKEVLDAGHAACSEAAAAIGAALVSNGENFNLCVKRDGLTNSAHVTIISNGHHFDPYREFFAKGFDCAIKQKFLAL
jgi:hypothetical protein